MTYEAYSTSEFKAAFRALQKVDQKRVTKVIRERICQNPHHNSKSLSGDRYAGLRTYHIGNLRLIYFIVEEVKAKGLEGTRLYLDCTDLPNEAVKLLFVRHRKDVYKWNP